MWVSKPNVLETDLQGALDQYFKNCKCSRYNVAIRMPNTKYWSSVDKAIEGDAPQPRKSSKGMRMMWKLNVAVKKEGSFCVYSATVVFQPEKHLSASKRKPIQEGEQSKGFSHFTSNSYKRISPLSSNFSHYILRYVTKCSCFMSLSKCRKPLKNCLNNQ